jgi:hypothetical protein
MAFTVSSGSAPLKKVSSQESGVRSQELTSFPSSSLGTLVSFCGAFTSFPSSSLGTFVSLCGALKRRLEYQAYRFLSYGRIAGLGLENQ